MGRGAVPCPQVFLNITTLLVVQKAGYRSRSSALGTQHKPQRQKICGLGNAAGDAHPGAGASLGAGPRRVNLEKKLK